MLPAKDLFTALNKSIESLAGWFPTSEKTQLHDGTAYALRGDQEMVLAPALKNGNCNISCHLLFCDAALNSADEYARSHQHCSLAVSNVYKCLHCMNPGQSGLAASSSFVFKWQWCACSVTTYLLFWHPSTSVRNATWKQMIYCSLSAVSCDVKCWTYFKRVHYALFIWLIDFSSLQ